MHPTDEFVDMIRSGNYPDWLDKLMEPIEEEAEA
jgi:hypothetical protein